MQSAISQDELVAGRKPTPIIRDAEQLLRRGIDAIERDHFEDAAGLLRQEVDLAPESAMASLVRELRALERKRALWRIWRPDFVGGATDTGPRRRADNGVVWLIKRGPAV